MDGILTYSMMFTGMENGRRSKTYWKKPRHSRSREALSGTKPESQGTLHSSGPSYPYGKAIGLRSPCNDAPESDLARRVSSVMEAVSVQ
jgi:hypothetical protein